MMEFTLKELEKLSLAIGCYFADSACGEDEEMSKLEKKISDGIESRKKAQEDKE